MRPVVRADSLRVAQIEPREATEATEATREQTMAQTSPSRKTGRFVVLIVGGGAREHALGLALAPRAREIVFAPGNPGTASIGRNVAVKVDDVEGIVALAVREHVDLVVVGPELPLTLGLVDALSAKGIVAFGPSKSAAKLEGSKVFMKRFLKRHGIATAAFEVFDEPAAAEAYIRNANRPLVIKADGLASGKGVVVAADTAEALEAVRRMMRERAFGDAGATILVEELLAGEEASFHVVCDGVRAVPLAAAQDHKRVFDGDSGPNTGGMGAYAPAPVVTDAVRDIVMRAVVAPTLRGMADEGAPFRGVLFVGLMIEHGVPRVLEFNVRFGDPETCVILPLYESDDGDLFDLLDSAARGVLAEGTSCSSHVRGAALCVVMAAEGYGFSAKVRSGDRIDGLDRTFAEEAFVLHAGTSVRTDGAVVTSGGRVLAVGARGANLAEASRQAYATVAAISWRGEHHRADIGHRALPVATAKTHE
jgi:phosphoribosylamine---glycine ligase